MIFKGKDSVLVRDRCILLCKQVTQSILKPQLPDLGQININTSVRGSHKLSDENTKGAHQTSPVCGNDYCHTKHIELNSNDCGCGSGIIAVELQGIKLELVILQKKFESKLDSLALNLGLSVLTLTNLNKNLLMKKIKTFDLSRNWLCLLKKVMLKLMN